ncbi:MAG TPA: hypothetical protein PLP23_15595 [Panacibacter sp.]|nr:hypothetical protein [Panacibacter sp.]
MGRTFLTISQTSNFANFYRIEIVNIYPHFVFSVSISIKVSHGFMPSG